MKVAVFNTKSYDRMFLEKANQSFHHELKFFDTPLNVETCKLGFGFEVICGFVNDCFDREVLKQLSRQGTKLIALRCAGFNNVDLSAAKDLNLTVARVPAYSPYGVAEHAVALILALNRKIYRAHNRVHDGNFSLEGLLGFEIHGKTVGILGTGKIGLAMVSIMKGFGTQVLAYDVMRNPACEKMGARYVTKEELFKMSDIISLHLPLTKETHHVIDQNALAQMKDGVMLINTSRGGLIDSTCLIEGLKKGKIAYLGLDVYEEEEELFFEDHTGEVIQDDIFARLLTFPNVLITGHQAFFTQNALTNIAETTLKNIADFEAGKVLPENEIAIARIEK
jgi:D-lactate dehydrogenase